MIIYSIILTLVRLTNGELSFRAILFHSGILCVLKTQIYGFDHARIGPTSVFRVLTLCCCMLVPAAIATIIAETSELNFSLVLLNNSLIKKNQINAFTCEYLLCVINIYKTEILYEDGINNI